MISAGILAWASIFAGLVAAGLWFWASTIVVKMDDPRSEGGVFIDGVDIYSTAERSTRINKWAAAATALTILLQTLAALDSKLVGG
jgi:hypothetical protein